MKFKNLGKKLLLGIVTAAGVMLAPEVFALSTTDNSKILTEYTSAEGSVNTVVTGVIGLGGAVTGLGLVYSWLRR